MRKGLVLVLAGVGLAACGRATAAPHPAPSAPPTTATTTCIVVGKDPLPPPVVWAQAGTVICTGPGDAFPHSTTTSTTLGGR